MKIKEYALSVLKSRDTKRARKQAWATRLVGYGAHVSRRTSTSSTQNVLLRISPYEPKLKEIERERLTTKKEVRNKHELYCLVYCNKIIYIYIHTHHRLFLHFKSALEKIWIFFYLLQLNIFFVFSNQFDVLISKIIF